MKFRSARTKVVASEWYGPRVQGVPRVPTGATFAFDTALRALDQRNALIASLDAKAGMILAAAGIFAGLLFTQSAAARPAPVWIVRAATAALGTSAAVSVWALFPRLYAAGAKPRTVAEMSGDYPDLADETLKWWFLPNLLEALDQNDAKLKWKRPKIAAAGTLLVSAVAVIGLSFANALPN